MTRVFKQVDVFTDELGMGNPVAVVLDADGMTDAEMARFAAWTNLSETTFVLSPTEPGADYRVRIFSPTTEFPFAGHPTVGTCHAWLEAGGQPADPDRIVQQCGAGLVPLRRIDERISFQTPPCTRTGPVEPDLLAGVLRDVGLDAADVVDTAWIDNGPGWVGILVDTAETLRGLTPSWTRMDLNPGIAALIEPADATGPALEVRAFFNGGGPREDPVTGSLNGSLAQWLVGNGTVHAPYTSSQGTAMGRDGRVHVSQDEHGEIWIGGDAVTGIDGEVHL